MPMVPRRQTTCFWKMSCKLKILLFWHKFLRLSARKTVNLKLGLDQLQVDRIYAANPAIYGGTQSLREMMIFVVLDWHIVAGAPSSKAGCGQAFKGQKSGELYHCCHCFKFLRKERIVEQTVQRPLKSSRRFINHDWIVSAWQDAIRAKKEADRQAKEKKEVCCIIIRMNSWCLG